MSKQIESVRSGLVAMRTLLSRDPCTHANTAIQMIDAMLAEQPAQQEPVKWSGYELDGRRYKTMEERLKDAFYEGFTSSATYNDIELNDVDEEWLKYAAAHGITKGNT